MLNRYLLKSKELFQAAAELRWQDLAVWPLPRQLVLLVVVALLSAVCWHWLLGYNQAKEKTALLQQEQRLRDAYASSLASASLLEQLKEQQSATENRIRQLQNKLWLKAEPTELLAQLNGLSKKYSLTVQQLQLGQTSFEQGDTNQQLDFELTGSYLNLVSFFQDVGAWLDIDKFILLWQDDALVRLQVSARLLLAE